MLKTKWDWFAVPGIVQWPLIFLTIGVILIGGVTGGPEILILTMICNILTILTPLATIFGSKHHEQLSPKWWYHILALLFGPFISVDYMYKAYPENKYL